jgi:hypothetical protein
VLLRLALVFWFDIAAFTPSRNSHLGRLIRLKTNDAI